MGVLRCGLGLDVDWFWRDLLGDRIHDALLEPLVWYGAVSAGKALELFNKLVVLWVVVLEVVVILVVHVVHGVTSLEGGVEFDLVWSGLGVIMALSFLSAR